MIKQLAWNTFKNTGSINTYLEIAQMKDFENTVSNNIEINTENPVSGNENNTENNIESNIE